MTVPIENALSLPVNSLWIEAAATLLTNGVFQGPKSKGPTLFNLATLRTKLAAYVNLPILLDHPEQKFWSPWLPEQLEKQPPRQHVGYVVSVRRTPDALLARALIDVRKLFELDSSVATDLWDGHPVCISPGLQAIEVPTTGTFEGEPYEYVINQADPHHLAIMSKGEGSMGLHMRRLFRTSPNRPATAATVSQSVMVHNARKSTKQ